MIYRVSSQSDNLKYKLTGYRRHGLSMFVVFVIIAMGTLLAMGLAYQAGSMRMGSRVSGLKTQAHSLAWSGLQAVMAELDTQRDVILAGGVPEVTDEWSLYGTGSERGMVRLIPLKNSGFREVLLESESAKLDVNAVDAETLIRLFEYLGLDEPDKLAKSIISKRNQLQTKRFLSIGDLLTVDGITEKLLWGEMAEQRIQSAVSGVSGEGGVNEADYFESRLESVSAELNTVRGGSNSNIRDTGEVKLGDYLTVNNYEPVLQETGKYKINVNTKWDDRYGRRIERRFGADFAQFIKTVKENDENFHITMEQAALIIARGDDPPNEWDQYIDAFTDSDNKFYEGRVDLNRASDAVIAAVTKFDDDTVAAIMSARDSLSSKERTGTTWLVEQGIINGEQWAGVVMKLTTRSFVWRVRVMGNILRGGGSGGNDSNIGGSIGNMDAGVRNVAELVYEAVIDLTSPQPRIAYLRDITMLETTASLAESGLTATGNNNDNAIEAETEDDNIGNDSMNDGEQDDSSTGNNVEMDNGRGSRNNNKIANDPESDVKPEGDTPENKPEVKQVNPSGRWSRGG